VRSFRAAVAVLLVAALVAGMGPIAHAQGSAHLATGATVLSVYQTPTNITEQDTMTVAIELSDSTNVQQVYFTFCQLTSPLCYLPIVMTPDVGNWYRGTTAPMTSYNGMDVGVRAGYNITIVYADSSNLTVPIIPNPFANLTVAQTVTGEYVYAMSVSDHVYDLAGKVYDAVTGAAVSGANVTLTPGTGGTRTTNASGGYSFDGLANGTYTMAVSGTGFVPSTVTVAISGQNLVKDVPLSNAGGSSSQNGAQPSGGLTGFLASPVGLGAIALVAIGVVIVGLVAYTRARARAPKRPPSGPAA